MKTRILFFITILLLTYTTSSSKEVTTGNNPSPEGSLKVFTSPDLFNLTTKWVSEYGSLYPKLKINLIKSADDNIAGMLNKDGGIGFVADESLSSLNNQNNWNMVVGRDVIVPVMNAANPFRDEIYRKGITPAALATLLKSQETPNWGMLIGNVQNIQDLPMHFYIMNDPSTIAGVENFLNTNQLSTKGNKTATGKEMISAIQKDRNALGFCKLIQVMDQNNQSLAENIKLIPIDKNGNGKVDYMENIYENLQAFLRGVWIGKYPKALAGSIYLVSSEKPKNKTEMAFMNWVLTEGQQFMNANGYNDLVLSERKTQLDKINEPVIEAVVPRNEIRVLLTMILLILFVFAVIGYIIDFAVTRIKIKKGAAIHAISGLPPVFDEDSVVIPKGLYFDKTHTWAFMKKDGTVKTGIDDFLQHVTGQVTRIEMKNAGEKIKKGDHLFTIIQKGKKLNIYSPISGTIASCNEALMTDSSLINASPYADGWVYTVEPTNWLLEIQFMAMNEKYKTWIRDEFARLKDFFASTFKTNTPEYAMITLQDGGALRDSILADFGPEVWDDFQTKFIDRPKNQTIN
jgi:glycine cleavage system H lipoate-binding protein/ABC-type phosphate transport system substrate-binding protein